jgi:hypothetical protein
MSVLSLHCTDKNICLTRMNPENTIVPPPFTLTEMPTGFTVFGTITSVNVTEAGTVFIMRVRTLAHLAAKCDGDMERL